MIKKEAALIFYPHVADLLYMYNILEYTRVPRRDLLLSGVVVQQSRHGKRKLRQRRAGILYLALYIFAEVQEEGKRHAHFVIAPQAGEVSFLMETVKRQVD